MEPVALIHFKGAYSKFHLFCIRYVLPLSIIQRRVFKISFILHSICIAIIHDVDRMLYIIYSLYFYLPGRTAFLRRIGNRVRFSMYIIERIVTHHYICFLRDDLAFSKGGKV